MKKRVFKKWVENVVASVFGISFLFIATTIESDWTKAYLILLGINLFLFITSGLLLSKYGRIED